MKKQFAIRALQGIKQMQHTQRILKAHGVDLINLENGTGLLEESIATMFTSNKEDFKAALSDVQWWLYEERVEKVIILPGDVSVVVEAPEAFIDWLAQHYSDTGKQG